MIRSTGGNQATGRALSEVPQPRVGWRDGFGDAGMYWTWLGPGFGSTELVVAEERAGGPAAVPGLSAARAAAFPALRGLAHTRAELYLPGRANKEAFCQVPALQVLQQAQPASERCAARMLWSMLWGKEKLRALILCWI